MSKWLKEAGVKTVSRCYTLNTNQANETDMDLNLFLLGNGERGINSFTANLTQEFIAVTVCVGCTGMSMIRELFVQPNSLNSC